MKKYIITLSLFMMVLNLSAQDVIWKMNYDVSFPFSATKTFTDQVSWRGLSFDVDRFVGDNLAVGVGFSWNVFVEKEPDSYYERPNVLLHGTQVRYINNIPLTARISWYQPMDTFEPYATLGIGTAWQEVRREIGTFAFEGDFWQFALTPEVGVVIPVGMSYLTARVRYVHAFETADAPNLSYLAIGLGFAW